MGFPRLILLSCAALVLFLIIAAYWLSSNWEEDSRLATYENSWSLVDRYYYDRTFNGLDWPNVKNTFLPKARSANDRRALYWTAINPMLALLESSHLIALESKPDANYSKGKSAEVLEQSWGRCYGATIVYGRSSVLPRIVAVERSSPAAKLGIQPDWRLMPGISPTFVDRSGKIRELELSSMPVALRISLKEQMKVFVAWRHDRVNFDSSFRVSALGFAVTAGREPSFPLIADVRPDSPALAQGLEPGSTISSLSLTKRRSTGTFITPSGTTGKFVFYGNCDGTTYNERSSSLIGSTLYARFDIFSPKNANWLRNEISSRRHQGLVLDLRQNSGGNIAAMLTILGAFVPHRTVVGRVVSAAGREALVTEGDQLTHAGPICVLVGPATASASELTAHVLKTMLGATLIGQRTAGEVVVASTFPLLDGGKIQIATHDLTTSEGQRLEGNGVAPDVTLWNSIGGLKAGRDETVTAAIKRCSAPA